MRIIHVIGDSTVMSYPASDLPRSGWGQQLIHFLGGEEVRTCPTPGSAFANAVTYESRDFSVDNRAMAGRSVRTFLEEGRMDDLLPEVREGDLVLMQFAHNDANRGKPERFAEPALFSELLRDRMIRPVRDRGGVPVLVTPIAMRDFDGEGRCRISFPAYREAMLALSEAEGVPVVDLGALTAGICTKLGPEGCKSVYLWCGAGVYDTFPEGSSDDAHLQTGGALLFASLAAKDMKRQGLI